MSQQRIKLLGSVFLGLTFLFAFFYITPMASSQEGSSKDVTAQASKIEEHIDPFTPEHTGPPTVRSELEKNESVAVVVWLKNNEFTSPEYQDGLDKKRVEIKKMQDDVLDALARKGVVVDQRYQVLNGFSAKVLLS